MYQSVRFASSLAPALGGEMRVLAHRGGRVRTNVFLNILRRESKVRERQNNLLTAP
jgi:hypothetical protein